ncbi:MAG: SRPBCC family protein [Acidimicrobiales bacterium]|nr:SRPBCC family protein [Acidimicrobiales bacterium]
MADIRVEIEIAAPPDEVWAFVEPVENHVDWMADAEAIRFTSESTRGVGTTFDCDTKVGPIKLTDKMEITEWEPGRRMGVRHVGLVTGTGAFSLEPSGPRNTAFVWAETLSFPWWLGGPIGEIVGAPILKLIWRRNLRRLKLLIERPG